MYVYSMYSGFFGALATSSHEIDSQGLLTTTNKPDDHPRFPRIHSGRQNLPMGSSCLVQQLFTSVAATICLNAVPAKRENGLRTSYPTSLISFNIISLRCYIFCSSHVLRSQNLVCIGLACLIPNLHVQHASRVARTIIMTDLN